MIAEILSVGTELLMGQILNSDAQYLSIQLSQLGVDVYYHTTVGDNAARLKDAFLRAFRRSDCVIATGGLGPTQDDITKECIADALGISMKIDEASLKSIQSFFKGHNRVMTKNNARQAVFPEGARILPNPVGTAPGCIIEIGEKCVVILPGPPHELKAMFEQSILPYLSRRTGDVLISRVLRVFGLGESALEDALKDLITAQTNPTLATYASYGEATLRITAKAQDDASAQALIDPVEHEVMRRVGKYVYGNGDTALPQLAAQTLIESKRTIGVAESCTGGMLCSMLINEPGMSAALMAGICAYANEAKIKLLDVSEQTLSQHGAVSEACAIEMAQGVRGAMNADIALSTTGIAGPEGGSDEKPVGTVFIGFADEKHAYAKRFQIGGARERIRTMTCLYALNMLLMELKSP